MALRRRLFAAVAASVSISLIILAVYSVFCAERFGRSVDLRLRRRVSSLSSRKLLVQGGLATERMGEGCSKDDIVVYQGQTEPLTTGIPTYTVEVHNLCSGGCGAMTEIHFSCEWFSSARLINPRVFRRLRHGDCLVNDGRPLRAGASVSFQYANSFKYPLSVSSAVCLP